MALLVAAAMLWGCSAQKEAADTYETYQGYACQDGSGHIKYGWRQKTGSGCTAFSSPAHRSIPRISTS